VIAWTNFTDAIAQGNLIQAFINSLIVTSSGTTLRIVFDLIIVFCVHKLMEYKTGKVIYLLVLACMFIPGTGWITLIKLYRSLGLYDSLFALILHGMVGSLPFNMIILLGFIQGVPKALSEAAEIDGCRDAQYLVRILVPVIKPAIVSVGILSFTNIWNSLFINLLLIRSKSNYTLPQALLLFKTEFSVQYSLIFAGVLFGAVPLIIMYIASQKSFTAALTGSIKG